MIDDELETEELESSDDSAIDADDLDIDDVDDIDETWMMTALKKTVSMMVLMLW